MDQGVRTGLFFAMLSLLAVLPLSDAVAQAGVFTCTKAGTVATFENQTTGKALGPDPADPEVCMSVNSASGERRLLFNFWAMPIRGNEAAVRAAMRGLATGRTKEATFDITLNLTAGDGRPSGNWQDLTETLRVLGTETITIGGKPISATVVERIEKFQGRTNTRRHYMDNATGSFVKMSEVIREGQVLFRGFEVTSISPP